MARLRVFLLFCTDIGDWKVLEWNQSNRNETVLKGVPTIPTRLDKDINGNKPSNSVFCFKTKNGESLKRDWLSYSPSKEAFFCFPCLLFCNSTENQKAKLARPGVGYSHLDHSTGWKKLLDKVTAHQVSSNHLQLYMEWKTLVVKFKNNTSVDLMIIRHYDAEVQKWREILKRYLDVILFCSTHDLALRGSSSLLSETENNGNFLGLLQLIAKYDPLLKSHLAEVEDAQRSGRPLKTTYLSGTSQNELLSLCGNKVRKEILKRLKESKYFGMSCDATPDRSKTEQTTLILRYAHLIDNEWSVEESFIEFIEFNLKKGVQLAELYLSRLKHFEVPEEDMRAQGYDNGSNMAGVHKGVQAEIQRVNEFALFSPCSGHSLNLCGVHSVQSTPRSKKYFSNIQRLYVLFAGSPGRWSIITSTLNLTFKSQSETRWSERVDSVKAVATQHPRVIICLQKLLVAFAASLTPDAKTTAEDLLKYFSSFESILHGTIWTKVMQMNQETSLLLQTRGISLDHQAALVQNLKEDLQLIRDSFPKLYLEATNVAKAMNISPDLKVIGTLLSGRLRRTARPNVLNDSTEEVSSLINMAQ